MTPVVSLRAPLGEPGAEVAWCTSQNPLLLAEKKPEQKGALPSSMGHPSGKQRKRKGWAAFLSTALLLARARRTEMRCLKQV